MEVLDFWLAMKEDFTIVILEQKKWDAFCWQKSKSGAKRLLGNKVRLFWFGGPTKHRVIATANIDNPKFEVVLLPTVGASSFVHDFLDRYLFTIAFHQLRHRRIGCVTALTFK